MYCKYFPNKASNAIMIYSSIYTRLYSQFYGVLSYKAEKFVIVWSVASGNWLKDALHKVFFLMKYKSFAFWKLLCLNEMQLNFVFDTHAF